MENRHTLVTSNDCVVNNTSDKDDSSQDEARDTLSSIPSIQGYLFKRTSNAFKTWNRRWFSLQDNQLVYRKRSGKQSSSKLVLYHILHIFRGDNGSLWTVVLVGEDVTIMEEDLRLCTVKPVIEGDRRFCFEVVSPNK